MSSGNGSKKKRSAVVSNYWPPWVFRGDTRFWEDAIVRKLEVFGSYELLSGHVGSCARVPQFFSSQARLCRSRGLKPFLYTLHYGQRAEHTL